MTTRGENVFFWAKANWYFVLLPIILCGNYAASKIPGDIDPRLNETAILFDLVFLLPALYAVCYRKLGRKIIIRILGIACMGIWLAGHLIPAEEQVIYAQIAFMRDAGLAFLTLIEIRISVFMFKLLFGRLQENENTVRQLNEKMDVPLWVAKLIVLEAAFWKRLWKFVRHLFMRR